MGCGRMCEPNKPFPLQAGFCCGVYHSSWEVNLDTRFKLNLPASAGGCLPGWQLIDFHNCIQKQERALGVRGMGKKGFPIEWQALRLSDHRSHVSIPALQLVVWPCQRKNSSNVYLARNCPEGILSSQHTLKSYMRILGSKEKSSYAFQGLPYGILLYSLLKVSCLLSLGTPKTAQREYRICLEVGMDQGKCGLQRTTAMPLKYRCTVIYW